MTQNGKYQNLEQDRKINELEKRFNIICENYNHEIGQIQQNISGMDAKIKILMWFMFSILAAIIGLYFKGGL